jgi:hypothetical protein
MGGENRVVTSETCFLQHGVVGEVLEVWFPRFTVVPSDATGDGAAITSPPVLRDEAENRQ